MGNVPKSLSYKPWAKANDYLDAEAYNARRELIDMLGYRAVDGGYRVGEIASAAWKVLLRVVRAARADREDARHGSLSNRLKI